MSSSEKVSDDCDSRTVFGHSVLRRLRDGVTRTAPRLPSPPCTDGRDPYCYGMDYKQRGLFIIINNKYFQPQTKLETRTGTEIDAGYLEEDFRNLGFTVTVFNNLTATEMLYQMITVAGQDHSDYDCFGMAILSHGDNSLVYGVDDVIFVERLVQPIKECQSLVGKPKIFIIQACQGNKFMESMDMHDGVEYKKPGAKLIPREADFLYAYSTVPGYFSWRNQANGSWFVQALHEMMQKYISTLDFVSLLTRVNYKVAYEFESKNRDPAFAGKKQVPSIVSMLTKDLYFTAKRT